MSSRAPLRTDGPEGLDEFPADPLAEFSAGRLPSRAAVPALGLRGLPLPRLPGADGNAVAQNTVSPMGGPR